MPIEVMMARSSPTSYKEASGESARFHLSIDRRMRPFSSRPVPPETKSSFTAHGPRQDNSFISARLTPPAGD